MKRPDMRQPPAVPTAASVAASVAAQVAPPVAAQGAPQGTTAGTPTRSGSRRRRLWELSAHLHCPLVGVCLPIVSLRRLVDHQLGGSVFASNYELHCGVIAECRQRGPLVEALQKQLDRRFQLTLQRAARLKTSDALAAWWAESSAAGPDLPGALWATLTHARCTVALEEQVLGEVHMRQHQVGAATRVDLARFDALTDENAVLTRALAAAQSRCQRQTREHQRSHDALEVELLRTRARLMGCETALAQLREHQTALLTAAPDLASRFELARSGRLKDERIVDLRRALSAAQQALAHETRRADEAERAAAAASPAARTPARPGPDQPLPATLADRAVLCVGGRPASVPAYRQLVERTGGRFLHHDGGPEQGAARLDATLAAADLVICQTGCVSHDAYWRVKDHCKRHGKRCVFVDAPSRHALARALGEVCAAANPTHPTRSGSATGPTSDVAPESTR